MFSWLWVVRIYQLKHRGHYKKIDCHVTAQLPGSQDANRTLFSLLTRSSNLSTWITFSRFPSAICFNSSSFILDPTPTAIILTFFCCVTNKSGHCFGGIYFLWMLSKKLLSTNLSNHNVLTPCQPSAGTILENIGPRSWQQGPSAAGFHGYSAELKSNSALWTGWSIQLRLTYL